MESSEKMKLPIMADLLAKGKKPEYLFWVGCFGAFDDRSKKITKAFLKILNHCNTDFAVLGKEETCCGDPVRRAGNEMLYQMQALTMIEILKQYDIKKIVTLCPHCFNIFKNDYPDLGGKYEVIHYTTLLKQLIQEKKLILNKNTLKDKRIAYHDPCYLGRANDEYDAPRMVLDEMTQNRKEMKRNRSFAFCCGAGGGQMFKEAEKGNKEIFLERTEEALETEPDIIATACPYCMVMFTDGLKYKNKEEQVLNLDITEIVVKAMDL
jgi:heterodisulfide reductase subunit D